MQSEKGYFYFISSGLTFYLSISTLFYLFRQWKEGVGSTNFLSSINSGFKGIVFFSQYFWIYFENFIFYWYSLPFCYSWISLVFKHSEFLPTATAYLGEYSLLIFLISLINPSTYSLVRVRNIIWILLFISVLYASAQQIDMRVLPVPVGDWNKRFVLSTKL